jgi:hypothetical protein
MRYMHLSIILAPQAADYIAAMRLSVPRIAELERVCGQLAVENAALKKALQRVQSKSVTSS